MAMEIIGSEVLAGTRIEAELKGRNNKRNYDKRRCHLIDQLRESSSLFNLKFCYVRNTRIYI